MYKVLLVDDEAIVREGIEDTIDWGALGFQFAGSCDNGADAAEAAAAIRPDLLITDICMPFVDGLDLTELVMARSPETKVILLTGYDEFEYARRALRLGAYDYVLKPITASELESLLARARRDLDAAWEERRRLASELAARRTRLLQGLLEGAAGEEAPVAPVDPALFAEAGLPVPRAPVAPLVALLDSDLEAPAERAQSGEPRERGRHGAALGPEDLGEGFTAITLEDSSRRRVALVWPTATDAAPPREAELAEWAEGVRGRIEARAGCTATLALGPFATSLSALPDSYRLALAALERRFVLGGSRVIRIERPGAADAAGEGSYRERAARLASALRDQPAPAILLECARFIDAVRSGFTSRARALRQIQEAIVLVAEGCRDIGIDLAALPGSDLDSLLALPTLSRIEERLAFICRGIAEARSALRTTFAGEAVERAVAHLRSHYRDRSLSLGSLCREIGVSTSYFCPAFKGQTGRTFVEYLTRMRIDEAMRLLRTTDLKSYEIAERVGYSDQHYFSIIFKKSTGMTPSEYRSHALGDPGARS